MESYIASILDQGFKMDAAVAHPLDLLANLLIERSLPQPRDAEFRLSWCRERHSPMFSMSS